MPYYEKSEDWLTQSSLLLQAYPKTTRVTTRYHVKQARRKTKTEKASDSQPPPSPVTEKPPRGHLVLKTFDPVSGVALKYKTSKAAEVGRLVQMLGTLGRRMAGQTERDDTAPATAATAISAEMEGVEATGGSGAQTPLTGAGGGPAGGQQGGGGGKGKKKRGKR